MKVLFTVQGEGRGHLTQALSMKEMLARRGHRVVGVVVGSNGTRPLPDYFPASFEVPVETIASPGFNFRQARGVSSLASLRDFLRGLPAYRRSLRHLRRVLRKTSPDLVINFLEPVMGLHNLIFGAWVPTLVVGHQYMLEHPAFPRVTKFRPHQLGMRAYIALVGARSSRLALSFYPAAGRSAKRLAICPPLLRARVQELEPAAGDYLLVYLLNHGYAERILRWHTLHPQVPVHCFHDRPGAPAEERVRPNLSFHRLDGERFLRLMAGCRAVATTAGFETACEAAYLGKPLLMVPVENHIEQYLNACDAEHAGLGFRDEVFQLSRLLEPRPGERHAAFRQWVQRAETIAMGAVQDCVGNRAEELDTVPANPVVSESAA